MTTTDFVIRRTGNRPLRFNGELLKADDSCSPQHNSRWHEIEIYRTSAGNFVLAIAYRTRWQGETDHYYAEFLNGDKAAQTIPELLRAYDPCANVQGYPATADYQSKQDRLLEDIRRRYESLVTDVLGEDFSELVA